jgi:hypothetical protein
MKYMVVLAVGLLLTGCAARELKVECDVKLQPINASAPATHVGKASP